MIVPDNVVLHKTFLIQAKILDPLLQYLLALDDGMVLLRISATAWN
jgi:hypothetical protein